MLATPELIRETAQLSQLTELLPRWRQIPLYRDALAGTEFRFSSLDFPAEFSRLPLLGKRDMRDGFPRNFIPEAQSLEALLEKGAIELEHTSGTSEERL